MTWAQSRIRTNSMHQVSFVTANPHVNGALMGTMNESARWPNCDNGHMQTSALNSPVCFHFDQESQTTRDALWLGHP